MRRYLIAVLILAASPALAQAPKAAQAKPAAANKNWTPPKTPWGEPDLQGVWNDATSTPLERPNGLASKGVLADEEAAEFAEQLANNLSRDRRDGGNEVDVNRAYNEHWMGSRRLNILAGDGTCLRVSPAERGTRA